MRIRNNYSFYFAVNCKKSIIKSFVIECHIASKAGLV